MEFALLWRVTMETQERKAMVERLLRHSLYEGFLKDVEAVLDGELGGDQLNSRTQAKPKATGGKYLGTICSRA